MTLENSEFKIIPAKNDAVFKRLFSENLHLLRQFISDILEIPVNEISKMKIINPELPPRYARGKMCRLDIIVTAGGKKFNIEMQVLRDEDFAERVIFYWAELFTSGVEKGTPYSDIAKTISINILGYKQFDWEDYHSVFTVNDMIHGRQLTDKLEIHFFELPKLDKKINLDNTRELWLHLINAERKEDFDMLRSAGNSFINEGIRRIVNMSADSKFAEYIRQHNKWEYDYLAGLNSAKKRGKAEGKAEGIAEGKAEGKAEGRAEGKAEGIEEASRRFVENMKKCGYSAEEIKRIMSIGEK